jgi:hypothetical protein
LEEKNMKRILFVGLIALLVLLAVPSAMAATTAPVTINGPVTASYSIVANGGGPGQTTGPWLQVGQNDWDVGTLVTTATNTAWAVSATTDGWSGYESRLRSNPSDSSKILQNPLMQLDTGSPAGFIAVKTYTDSGLIGDTGHSMPLYYRQQVLNSDMAGSYTLTITYNIAAV